MELNKIWSILKHLCCLLAVTLLCLLALFGYGLAQDAPRPVVPLPTDRTDSGISQRLQAAVNTLSEQEREQMRRVLVNQWRTAVSAAPDQTVRPQSGGIQSGATQRNETGIKIKYPPPGANAPNTVSETSPQDDADEGDTGAVVADDSKVINAAVRQFALDVLTVS